MVHIALSTSISDAWGASNTIVTVPQEYRPDTTISAPVAAQAGDYGSVIVRVDTNGKIYVLGRGTTWTGGWVFASFSYISIK